MNNELKHFGVLGMKWGVHKKKPPHKDLGPVKITMFGGNQYLQDTPGIDVMPNVHLSRGHNKISKDYDELVKKSKKQYGKDLVDARLKTYNRLYRKPFGRSELKHYGILGMKWGKRKDKQSGSSSSPKSSEHVNYLKNTLNNNEPSKVELDRF